MPEAGTPSDCSSSARDNDPTNSPIFHVSQQSFCSRSAYRSRYVLIIILMGKVWDAGPPFQHFTMTPHAVPSLSHGERPQWVSYPWPVVMASWGVAQTCRTSVACRIAHCDLSRRRHLQCRGALPEGLSVYIRNYRSRPAPSSGKVCICQYICIQYC